ncbi:hypothetical protein Q8A73_023740 [Channa argus]|nr:hypothetical protein Q8A73_023740 [Channa argus]
MDTTVSCVHVYDRQTLLRHRVHTYNNLHEEVIGNLRDLGLLRPQRQIPGPQPSVSPDAGGQVRGRRKRCSRKRKRGKRAGVRARLNANPSRPALPSILLSNVCSLDNKLDYIRLQRTTRREFRDCCIFVFTETWLSDRVPEAAIQLDGLTVFRADRNAALCGKTRGGGVCVYINTEWCKNSVLVSRFCSSLVEFVTVRCRPFYLPREFTTVFIVGVYIPPSANAKEALCELYGAISDLQNAHPDGLFIIAGDFNHANLRTVLPKLHQHVDFATRGGNTLDLVYTNIPGAYRAEPRPHLGYSDHISVMLIPAYRPLVRRSKPVLKQVKTWPAGATSALQDCFECTDWDMFREAATNGDSINLEEYTSTVTSYISKCVDDVTISKTITTRSNRKPWINANVCALLKQRDAAFRTGDKTALRTARAKLSRAIREAKRAHSKKIHDHFEDTRRMWQGIQAITNYKTTSPDCDRDASLPDALNHFYARFEAQNNVKARKSTPPPSDQVLCLTTAEVRKTLCRVNPRKSAGPDNIPGRVLRECAEQLADVFTDIFNISLSSNVVPTCLKATTIVPVPKKSTVSCLNDYRPVALTPIVMKCFERLVMRHIKTQLPTSLDPMQFAYRPNRSTDDAISTTLHLALTHLDSKDSYVRMLFIDFSSAFNTIIPQHLTEKLSILGLNTSLCNWILDFLTGRPQSVRIGNNISSTTTLSTGAPQGCVLSPLLFTLLTHDCVAMHSSNHIVKFADDTTVVGLISKNDESAYREEVQRLTAWCGANNLSLNVDKTKEMVVDFRRAQGDHSPLFIDGSSVEIVKSTKFLGVHLADNLTWSVNTSSITKKAQQRLYFLRRLRKAHLPPPILTMFYRGTIESILSSCITAWFGNCTVADRKTLQRIVRTAEKIIGVSLPSIMHIYTTRCIRKANSIVDDPTHPSHTLFTLLPSGKRVHTYNNLHEEVIGNLRDLGLLRPQRQIPGPQPSVSPDAGGQVRGRRKRCSRKRKRGKRAGVRARLNANPSRPALPSILLSNVCSLDNKLDYIRLQRTTRREFRDCCIFVFTETWLSDRVPEAAIQLDGLTVFRADRNAALCGKTRGGGVCVYINTEWCKNSVLVSRFCSSLVEFVTVRCRPFYLPREFTTVFIVGVYIPPSANAKEALCELYGAISDLQNAHPDGLFIIAGDFNHANLRTVLPKLHQHVDFATRGGNTLDLVYTNIPGAYRAEPRPHLGYSDHISVMLIPAYRPLVRRSKPVLKQVKTWPAGATSALQDCFECTDWDMFREAATNGDSINLEEYTSTVTSYISKCVDDVTISKTITTRSNRKPWINANVCALLKQRDAAFRTGDKTALRTARAKLSRAIREAKRAHSKKIHDHFEDTRRMWQGIQAITNYKTTSPDCDRDASLPDALNHFYARFEAQNNVKARKSTPPPSDQVLCLTTAEVRKTLCRVNPRKSAGPDNIPGRVLRECAEQLADVFTDIFNISLSSNVVPTCLKATTIVPVPKKSTVSCLNDYRPVALTPIVMKCFERLVMRHIKTQLPTSLDPMQFAYRPNRSTDDAISTTLHLALTHLDSKDSYVRMLFIDFSSAFNTIIPQHLTEKLSILGLNTSLCNWILDFLTGRPQSVRIGNNISSTTTLSTGAPQGCVLSPLLFTLLTHDCVAMHSSNHIVKFADDTTVVGLISKNDESAYREEVQRLTAWCGANNLSLNVDKTKEMVVDFRRAQGDHSPLFIDGSSVEIVKSTKFLGVHLADNLTWSVNTSSITKKAQQRLYFLRRLRKAHLPPPILTMFYRGTIESILSSCITAWFGNCTVADRKTLQRIVRTAEKIIGVSLPSIMHIYTTRCIRKANSIVDDPTHPSHTLFTLLPSGKRFRSIRATTSRLCNSFFPQAIRLLNTQN